jgi:hypothetical protein
MAPNVYVDYSNSYLYLRAKVMGADGSALDPNEQVAISNLCFYTMFQDLQVTVAGRAMSDSNMMYPYRGILTTLLGRGNDSKTSLLSSIGLYPDTAQDSFTDANKGWKVRKDLVAGSKTFDILGKPSAPIFDLAKWMPAGVKVDLSFIKHAHAFAIDTSTDKKFTFSIEDATLYLKVNTLSPEITTKLQQRFDSGAKATYGFRDIQLLNASIPTGCSFFQTEQLFGARKPSFITIALVDSSAFQGNFKKSCLNFQHFSVISVSVRSDEMEPFYKELKCDYASGQYLQPFNSIFSALAQNNGGNGIDREIYKV